MAVLSRPFVVSHTGLTNIADKPSRWRRYSAANRNIPSAIAAEVGRRGGLVGICLSTQLLGGSTLDAAARTFAAAIGSAGEDRVAIGSDMDGALKTVIDVEGLPSLASALLDYGLTESTVRKVLGASAASFFERAVPGLPEA